MPVLVNDAGVWKTATEVWVNDAGTWKRAEVSANDAGTWKVAASAAVVVTIAPTSRSASNPNGTATFPATTVTVTGGTPTSYTWGFLSPTGGTWVINSGQGTASAAARVNGSSGGTATLYCDVVVNGQTTRVTCPHTYTFIT